MQEYLKFYTQLNTLQRQAVDAIDGPLLVLAGPGTGKTQLLSVRAGSILSTAKVNPDNILILTYTNSAAKAMKERLAAVTGSQGYDVEVGTFHSFANSIIQDSAEAANYAGDRILMDNVEAAGAVQYILDTSDGLDEIRPFRAPYTYLKDILKKISELKKDDITPADLDRYLKQSDSRYRSMEAKHIDRLKAFSIVYRRYEELKNGKTKGIFDERGRYDFDDMILCAVQAMRKEASLCGEYRQQYRYVMVDEYQDTNGAQMDLLFTLLDYKDPNICCVGDDDQSIYRFQGANVANFRRLERQFPGIRKLSLTDNYRSSDQLIKASKQIIGLIPADERVEDKPLVSINDYAGKEILYKELSTPEEELIYIVDKVRQLKGRIEQDRSLSEEERRYPYNNIAILVRKRDQILRVIDSFLQAGIPYATDGKEDISGERRVTQLLDALQLAHIDPRDYEAKDTALYKVLSADYFGIPQPDILTFLQYVGNKRRAEKARVTVLGEFLSYFSSDRSDIVFRSPEAMRRAAGAIKKLIGHANDMPVHTVLIDFIKDAGLYTYILAEYAGSGILRIRHLRAIGSFVNMVKASDLANPAIRLDGFLAEIQTRTIHGLPVQGDLVTLTQAGVRVYTAHGSKGLEFHSVILPFCLQNKSWPAKPIPDKLPLPFDLFKAKEEVKDKDTLKRLSFQDETRLFYVAMTRARSTLIFTASPTEDNVPAQYLEKLGFSVTDAAAEPGSEEILIGKSLEATDAADPFIGTEEILKDMVSHITLNPTRLNNYIACRRAFLYNDVLKLPGAKRKSLVFGNCVHKALEETYRSYRESGKFPAFSFFGSEFAKELKYQGADTMMARSCLNKLKTLKDWFALAAKASVMPVDLEKKLMVTIGDNIIFTGKYDKVEWEDQAKGLVRILDYKTGKPDEHLKAIDLCADLASPECDGYLRQLVAYKLLFEKDKRESRGRKVSHGVLVFIEPVSGNIGRKGHRKGDYVATRVEISDGMVGQLERVIQQAWSDIKSLRFEKLKERDEKRCGKCDFENICWG